MLRGGQPLTLLHTILAAKVPFVIPFIDKRYPFHIRTLEHCTPFLSPRNEVDKQYYRRISNITRRNAVSVSIRYILINGSFQYLSDQFPYPFIHLSLLNPYSFIYPKPENVTPFGQSLPIQTEDLVLSTEAEGQGWITLSGICRILHILQIKS